MTVTNANELLNEMKANSIPPNVYIFNQILRNLRLRDNHLDFFLLWKRMRQENVIPDDYCWAEYFEGIVRWEGAVVAEAEFMEEVRTKQNLGTHVWNIILMAHGNQRDYKRVHELYRKLLDAGLQPDNATYNQLTYVYLQEGNELGASKLFQEAEDRGQVDGILYYNFISHFARKADPNKAIEYLDAALQRNLRIRETAFKVLLKAYLGMGDWEGAKRVEDQMSECQKQGLLI
ncbi:hypothetical protein HDV00_002956 [Rhizophlyctis rosea]|nr:hypothetical protein HDV00_002956 [Rhizophlyctis rosea]